MMFQEILDRILKRIKDLEDILTALKKEEKYLRKVIKELYEQNAKLRK